jgi:hypothetical protein
MLEYLKPSGNYRYHTDMFCIRTQCTNAPCMVFTINTVSLCNHTRLVFFIGQRLRCLGNVNLVFMLIVDECQSLKADIWQSLKTDIRHLDLHINYIYRIQLLLLIGTLFRVQKRNPRLQFNN